MFSCSPNSENKNEILVRLNDSNLKFASGYTMLKTMVKAQFPKGEIAFTKKEEERTICLNTDNIPDFYNQFKNLNQRNEVYYKFLDPSTQKGKRKFDDAFENEENDESNKSARNEELISCPSNEDLISRLPNELHLCLAEFIDGTTLGKMMRVSTGWNSFFNQESIWREKLSKDFNIRRESLLCKQTQDHAKLYRHVYGKLYLLQKRQDLLNQHFRDVYRPHYQKQLIACCLDDLNNAREIIPREEYHQWLKVCLLMNSERIYKFLFLFFENRAESLLYLAIQLKNLSAIKFLAANKNVFKITINNRTLEEAIKSNHLPVIKYFLDESNEFNIQPNYGMLPHVVQTHNIAIIELFLDPKYQIFLAVRPGDDPSHCEKKPKPFVASNKEMAKEAARSGNPDLFNLLLSKFENRREYLCPAVFTEAVKSGNAELVKDMLKANRDLVDSIKPALVGIAYSTGNLILVDHLLSLIKDKKGFPDSIAILQGILSGNIDIAGSLLPHLKKESIKKKLSATLKKRIQKLDIPFTPDDDFSTITLAAAIHSRSVEMVNLLFTHIEALNFISLNQAIRLAINANSLGIVRYLLAKNITGTFELSMEEINLAIQVGNVEIIKSLLESNKNFHPAINEASIALAARHPNATIELIEFLFSLNPELQITQFAASFGHYFVVYPAYYLSEVSNKDEMTRYLYNPEISFSSFLPAAPIPVHPLKIFLSIKGMVTIVLNPSVRDLKSELIFHMNNIHSDSPRELFRWVIYLLSHSNKLKISDETCDTLRESLKNYLLGKKQPYSIVECDDIRQLANQTGQGLSILLNNSPTDLPLMNLLRAIPQELKNSLLHPTIISPQEPQQEKDERILSEGNKMLVP